MRPSKRWVTNSAENLAPFKEVIYVFTNTSTPIINTVNLKVSLGIRETRVSRMTQFEVVKVDSSYNALLGDQQFTVLRQFHTLLSLHVIRDKGRRHHHYQRTTDNIPCCLQESFSLNQGKHTDHLRNIWDGEGISLVDVTKLVNIEGWTIGLGTAMSTLELKGQVLATLRQCQGNFVWEGEAPTQVDWSIISHKAQDRPKLPREKAKTPTPDRRQKRGD